MTIFTKKFKLAEMPTPRKDGAVVFNMDTGGAGDLLSVLGYVLGYRQMGYQSWLYGVREDYKNLLALFGEEPRCRLEDGEGSFRLGGLAVWHTPYMSARHKYISYIDHQHSHLPHNPPWVQPKALHRPEDLSWADALWATLVGEKRVLCFPKAAYNPRSWPLAYWSDLCWALKHEKCKPICFMPSKDETQQLPHSIWGITWQQTAALIKTSDLVVCNDSGPMHLAGVMGHRALAMVGSTTGMAQNYPSVSEIAVSKREVGCVGCWFDAAEGYRSACDLQCGALLALNSATVTSIVLRELDPTHTLVGTTGRASLPHLTKRPSVKRVLITVKGKSLGTI